MTRRLFLRNLALLVGGIVAFPRAARAQAMTLHVVKKGETLSSIATRYDVSVASIKIRNGLKNDRILVGQKLIIPHLHLLEKVIAATKRLKIQKRRWKYVVIHHSGIDVGNAKSYGQAHLERGMENGLAYHFLIGNGHGSGDGEIEIGPRWTHQLDGGHSRSAYYNAHGIGICLVGNFEKHAPTARQMISLTALIDWLRDEAPLGGKPKFTVHRWADPKHTLCPGKYFPYKQMQERYR